MLIMRNGGFALEGLARAMAARYRNLADEIEVLADGGSIDITEPGVIERWFIDASGAISGDLVTDGERSPVWTADIVVWDRDAGLIRTPQGWFVLTRPLKPGDIHPGPCIDLEAACLEVAR